VLPRLPRDRGVAEHAELFVGATASPRSVRTRSPFADGTTLDQHARVPALELGLLQAVRDLRCLARPMR
jgi:hypothetical protein